MTASDTERTVPGEASEAITTYRDFWPYYLREHVRPTTRYLHFAGTALGLALLAYAVASQTWWLLVAALAMGYLWAWIAHFFIEKNRPATFTYPVWSFVSDFRMLGFWLAGKLEREYERYQIRPG